MQAHKIRSRRKGSGRVAIDQAFNETVEYYDSWIKKAVPGYADLFAAAKELIPLSADGPVDVLDLGAGTGLFASQVLEQYPLARSLGRGREDAGCGTAAF
jgi:ubiquinone/menaquinone biosynthesis C-methylase UbiE